MLNQKYYNARINLIILIGFTVLNLVLLVSNSNSYFLFSATIPYILTDLGMFLCGMYPPEFYTENSINMLAAPPSFFYAMLALSAVIIILYLVSFFLSKRKAGWLIFALVFFSIDTLAMFLYFGISMDMIIDIVFHGWVIVILAQGVHAHYKLRSLPPEPAAEAIFPLEQSGEEEVPAPKAPDSPILRAAADNVKSKTLLEFNAYGHKVIYRRVKRTNELIIDGNVYAEYTALLEGKHTLTATVGGHDILVGFDSAGISFGAIDGITAITKRRFI